MRIAIRNRRDKEFEKQYNRFIKKLDIKKATQQLKDLVSKRPDSFAYHGDKDLFNTWSMFPYGVVTRDDADTLPASNQAVIYADLQSINKKHIEIMRSGHWLVGWVEQMIAKVLHNGKPTKVGLRVLFWIDRLDGYPVADDCDYSDRESEAEMEEVECYEEEFKNEVEEYVGDLSFASKYEIKEFIQRVYSYDCGYRGRENAWVDKEGIERFMKYEGYPETNSIIKKLLERST